MTSSSDLLNLLHEIKEKTADCSKNNEYIRYLIGKLSKNPRKNHFRKITLDTCDLEKQNIVGEDAGNEKFPDDLEYLEHILQEKLHENARLKTLNEKLLMKSSHKSLIIKELTNSISLQSEQTPKATEISKYRNEIGQHNVEIQKLKRQLGIETKKLESESARRSRLEKKNSVKVEQYKANMVKKKSNIILIQKLKKSKPQIKVTKPLFHELDEMHNQKATKIIELNDEPDLLDETLDVPENLDFDVEEMPVMKENDIKNACRSMLVSKESISIGEDKNHTNQGRSLSLRNESMEKAVRLLLVGKESVSIAKKDGNLVNSVNSMSLGKGESLESKFKSDCVKKEPMPAEKFQNMTNLVSSMPLVKGEENLSSCVRLMTISKEFISVLEEEENSTNAVRSISVGKDEKLTNTISLMPLSKGVKNMPNYAKLLTVNNKSMFVRKGEENMANPIMSMPLTNEAVTLKNTERSMLISKDLSDEKSENLANKMRSVSLGKVEETLINPIKLISCENVGENVSNPMRSTSLDTNEISIDTVSLMPVKKEENMDNAVRSISIEKETISVRKEDENLTNSISLASIKKDDNLENVVGSISVIKESLSVGKDGNLKHPNSSLPLVKEGGNIANLVPPKFVEKETLKNEIRSTLVEKEQNLENEVKPISAVKYLMPTEEEDTTLTNPVTPMFVGMEQNLKNEVRPISAEEEEILKNEVRRICTVKDSVSVIKEGENMIIPINSMPLRKEDENIRKLASFKTVKKEGSPEDSVISTCIVKQSIPVAEKSMSVEKEVENLIKSIISVPVRKEEIPEKTVKSMYVGKESTSTEKKDENLKNPINSIILGKRDENLINQVNLMITKKEKQLESEVTSICTEKGYEALKIPTNLMALEKKDEKLRKLVSSMSARKENIENEIKSMCVEKESMSLEKKEEILGNPVSSLPLEKDRLLINAISSMSIKKEENRENVITSNCEEKESMSVGKENENLRIPITSAAFCKEYNLNKTINSMSVRKDENLTRSIRVGKMPITVEKEEENLRNSQTLKLPDKRGTSTSSMPLRGEDKNLTNCVRLMTISKESLSIGKTGENLIHLIISQPVRKKSISAVKDESGTIQVRPMYVRK